MCSIDLCLQHSSECACPLQVALSPRQITPLVRIGCLSSLLTRSNASCGVPSATILRVGAWRQELVLPATSHALASASTLPTRVRSNSSTRASIAF